MKITSESFSNGKAIAAEFAMGQPIGDGFGFAGNRNPHFTFAEVPTAARSLALLCVDSDVPTVAEMVGKAGVEIPVDQPRCDFVHWLMIDIPGDCRAIAAGACSDGVTAHGKHAPAGPRGSRQGLNDYTAWFAADPDMAGDYLVTTARSRRPTTCACTAISSACSRSIAPSWRFRNGSRPTTCSGR